MKKIISLTLILLLIIALVGCGGQTENTETANDDETANIESSNEESSTEEETKDIEEEIVYEDGVYDGEAEGMHHLKVSVEVEGGKIAKVEVVEHEETSGIADPALEQVPAAIVEKNSTNVDTVSGATFTSEGIMNAVKNALESAKQ